MWSMVNTGPYFFECLPSGQNGGYCCWQLGTIENVKIGEKFSTRVMAAKIILNAILYIPNLSEANIKRQLQSIHNRILKTKIRREYVLMATQLLCIL